MDFKKTLCVLLAAAAVMCAGVGCGKDEDSKSGDTKTSAAASVSVTETAEKLKSEVTFDSELTEHDASKIDRIHGITEDKYTEAKVYVDGSSATPEEIACFAAVDSDAAAEIKAVLQAEIDSQKDRFKDYAPEQAPKLDDAVLVVKGNNVYMCVSGDNAKAKEIIG
ncbi:MAG: DUF4358 domain-containing protein [Ruminococcus sp.]|nr:DUF4358 domain-containing protein [Ruminococcus sp.]